MLASLQQIHERTRYSAATQLQEGQHAWWSALGLSNRGQDNRPPMREIAGIVMGEQTGHPRPVEDGVKNLELHVFPGLSRAAVELSSGETADEEFERRGARAESEQETGADPTDRTLETRFHD